MSATEARVHLELERLGVPFSWRFFDGESVTLTYLIPDFTPEFTLKEYKSVIIVVGGFFGTLPGILDKNALAAVALEEDGWKVAFLNEDEIIEDVTAALKRQLPEVAAARTKGPIRTNPYGQPNFMAKRRAQLAGQALEKSKFTVNEQKQRVAGRTANGRKRIRARARNAVVDRSAARR